MTSFSRRTFMLLSGALGFSTFVSPSSSKEGLVLMDSFEQARNAFARAIALKRSDRHEEAKKSAEECLALLKGRETMEETAAGAVVAVLGHVVCEPSYLHENTARERFRQEKILA